MNLQPNRIERVIPGLCVFLTDKVAEEAPFIQRAKLFEILNETLGISPNKLNDYKSFVLLQGVYY